MILAALLALLLAGCVFAENETTACPYCNAQITLEEAGDHRLPGCGVAEHAICVAGASAEHEKCEICGGPLCTGVKHQAGYCEQPGHCLGDGNWHITPSCGKEGHFCCDGMDHQNARCGIPGHKKCDGIDHDDCNDPMSSGSDDGLDIVQPSASTGEACPTCGDPPNDGNDHGATDCHFSSTHRHCDGLTHERCDICKGWLCNGSTHAPGICDQLPEETDWDAYFGQLYQKVILQCPYCKAPMDASHNAACGISGHYTCMDETHWTPCAGCGGYTCTPGYNADDHEPCETCKYALCSDYHRNQCGIK